MFKTEKSYMRTLGIKGLYYLLHSKFIGSKNLREIKIPDLKHPFHLRIQSSDVPTFKQVFIDKEYEFQIKNQPKVIIDAGANIGLASIYFANKYPNSKIIAIEPEKNNFLLLKKNTELYPNIIPLQAALWDKNEEIELVDPGLGEWGFMTENKSVDAKLGAHCHKVAAVTVDKIIKEYKLDKVDILKIDIEGAEKEVFNDTSAWLDNTNSIIIELHERMKSGCNRSFYCGSQGFDIEWHQGENVYLSRENYLVNTSK